MKLVSENHVQFLFDDKSGKWNVLELDLDYIVIETSFYILHIFNTKVEIQHVTKKHRNDQLVTISRFTSTVLNWSLLHWARSAASTPTIVDQTL